MKEKWGILNLNQLSLQSKESNLEPYKELNHCENDCKTLQF